jgi:hypothetical protein
MKKLLSVAVLALSAGLFGGQTHADRSKCVSMDNDIARLACFDEAYLQAKPTSLTPDEAIKALAELVNVDTSHERLILTGGEDRCALNVLYEGSLSWEGLRNPYQMNSWINLSNVERLGHWRGISDWRSGLRGIIAYTDRTAEGVWQSRIGNGYIAVANKSDINYYKIPITDTYQGRDSVIYLLVEDYRPDAAKVEKALWDAILACGGGAQ